MFETFSNYFKKKVSYMCKVYLLSPNSTVHQPLLNVTFHILKKNVHYKSKTGKRENFGFNKS